MLLNIRRDGGEIKISLREKVNDLLLEICSILLRLK